MFENILGFWKGKDFLTQVIDEFKTMLDDTEKMFDLVCQSLLDNVNNPGLKDQIYAIDKQVNQAEKNIRKRIVEHLSLQPKIETSWCLCLMSVVKDAERLGDYSKNLFEVKELLEKPIDRKKFSEYFNSIDKEILDLFSQTKQAFLESDNTKASGSWEIKTRVGTMCDETITKLASCDLSTNEGVCYVLIARHFKRISSHLVNIATSVILPVTELDYYDEDKAKE